MQWAGLQMENAWKIKREFLVCMGGMQEKSEVCRENQGLLYRHLQKNIKSSRQDKI
jgi:hypothetical protein